MDYAFIVGEVYFQVKYAEYTRKYPLIDSFVYVGKNLSEEDSEETWYFQFGDSFGTYGSVLDNSGGDRRVSCLAVNELSSMLNEERLMDELRAAAQRRR
jgi:hypothetical protein